MQGAAAEVGMRTIFCMDQRQTFLDVRHVLGAVLGGVTTIVNGPQPLS